MTVHRLLSPLRRHWHLVMGAAAGSAWSYWYSMTQLPEGTDMAFRFRCWRCYLSGPFSAFAIDWGWGANSVVDAATAGGFLGCWLLAINMFYPNRWTAIAGCVGLLLWFSASYVTIGLAIWG